MNSNVPQLVYCVDNIILPAVRSEATDEVELFAHEPFSRAEVSVVAGQAVGPHHGYYLESMPAVPGLEIDLAKLVARLVGRDRQGDRQDALDRRRL